MKPNLTLRQVFDQLIEEGMQVNLHQRQAVFSAQPAPESPWYVRLFAGVGAWVAAMFLIAFVISIGLLSQSEFVNLGAGLIIGVLTVAFYPSKNAHIFIEQFSLSLIILAQIIVTISLAMILDEIIPVALVIIFMEITLIWLYPHQFHRFLSYLSIIAAMIVICFDIGELSLFPALTITLTVGLIIIMLKEYELWVSSWWDFIHPLRYALTVGVLGLPLHTLILDESQRWFGSALILLGLIGGVVWLIKGELKYSLGTAWQSVLLVLGVGLAALSISVPGITVALLVLILGFWRGNLIIQGLAVAAFLYYLGAYYYTLQTTLLVKSMILIGTGILILASRWIVIKYNQQESL